MSSTIDAGVLADLLRANMPPRELPRTGRCACVERRSASPIPSAKKLMGYDRVHK